MMTIDIRVNANLVASARLKNLSALAPVSDYDLRWDEDGLHVPPMDGCGRIVAHRREQSVWALVETAAALICAQQAHGRPAVTTGAEPPDIAAQRPPSAAAGVSAAASDPVPLRLRRQLPPRRQGTTRSVCVPSGQELQVTINRDPVTGRLAEVFASSSGRGSTLELELADACVAASLLLQHGCPPASLAKSLHKRPVHGLDGIERWAPATMFGAVVAALCEEEGKA